MDARPKRKIKKAPRAVTTDRIFDFLFDVQLRNRRDSGESVTRIAMDHGLSSALVKILLQEGFLEHREGSKAYTYTGMEPSKEIAQRVFELYSQFEASRHQNGHEPSKIKSAAFTREEFKTMEKKIDKLTIVFCSLYKELTGHEFLMDKPKDHEAANHSS